LCGRRCPFSALGGKIEQFMPVGVGDADFRHHFIEIPPLRGRHAPLAQHEAADRAAGEAVRGHGVDPVAWPHAIFFFRNKINMLHIPLRCCPAQNPAKRPF
jgi:hypothetical protein